MTANVFPFILFPVQKILIPRNAIRSSRAFGTEHLSFVPARAPDDGIVEMKGLEGRQFFFEFLIINCLISACFIFDKLGANIIILITVKSLPSEHYYGITFPQDKKFVSNIVMLALFLHGGLVDVSVKAFVLCT